VITPKMRKFWADIDALNAKPNDGGKSFVPHATVAASGGTDVARRPAAPPTAEIQIARVKPSAKSKPSANGKASRAVRVGHPLQGSGLQRSGRPFPMNFNPANTKHQKEPRSGAEGRTYMGELSNVELESAL
jgi:hypothetical protein